MIKLIIFDLDDTLYQEASYVRSGFKAVAKFLSKKYGIAAKKIERSLNYSFVHFGRGKNFDFIMSKYNLKGVSLKKLVDIYQRHRPSICLHPGVEKILQSLRKKFKLVILTNGWIEVQKRKISVLRLERYFDAVFYAQEHGLKFRKPHKKYFLQILKYYGLNPSEVLMVGDDMASDIVGARRLGIKTCHIKERRCLKKIPSVAVSS